MPSPPLPNPPVTLSLSLVSHTNVGKTTLARTLLGRDVGEVRDAAHVTETAEPHELAASPDGDRLLLWDTPGFGDSQRLARRLAMAGNPLGWFLGEVWDRWRDRAFWASQRAIRHVLGQSDVVLYLVNAAESPDDAGYLDAELKVLALIGKPVIALLNQLGPAGAPNAEDALTARWRQRLQDSAPVRAVLPLDAFTRCWVQEGVLWAAVAEVLPAGATRQGFERLRAAWQQRQQATFDAAMVELARRMAAAALDTEPVPRDGWRGGLRAVGKVLGLGADAPSPAERAMAGLAERLDARLRQSTDRLIALHGLDGHAGAEVMDKLARHYAVTQPLDEGKAALWGGIVTGALAGLKADIVSGGLTMGGGLLAGGVLGALGAAGAARGVNTLRGTDQPTVAWDERVLDALLANALLGYLAVAHHGRGRGAWVAAEPPAAWVAAVQAALAERRAAVEALWRQREGVARTTPADEAALDPAWVAAGQRLLADAAREVLARLYPAAQRLAGPAPAATSRQTS